MRAWFVLRVGLSTSEGLNCFAGLRFAQPWAMAQRKNLPGRLQGALGDVARAALLNQPHYRDKLRRLHLSNWPRPKAGRRLVRMRRSIASLWRGLPVLYEIC